MNNYQPQSRPCMPRQSVPDMPHNRPGGRKQTTTPHQHGPEKAKPKDVHTNDGGIVSALRVKCSNG